MSPTWPDHLVVFLFAVVLPIYVYCDWPRFVASVRAGHPGARRREYATTIAVEWWLTGLALWRWFDAGRPFDALGLGASWSWRFLAAAAFCAVVTFRLLRSLWRAARITDWSRLDRAFAGLLPLVPHTRAERGWFFAVSATAGTCEEILFRGFLLWWLSAFVGVVGAVPISAVMFGLGHAYQGRAGIAKTGVVGLVMMLLYVLGGSLWPLFLLHTVMDVQGGAVGYLYVRGRGGPGVAAAPATAPA